MKVYSFIPATSSTERYYDVDFTKTISSGRDIYLRWLIAKRDYPDLHKFPISGEPNVPDWIKKEVEAELFRKVA